VFSPSVVDRLAHATDVDGSGRNRPVAVHRRTRHAEGRSGQVNRRAGRGGRV